MSIDVLFINPGHGDLIYQDLSKEFTAKAPPTWALLIAGGLINKGFSCAIYDVNVEGWNSNTPQKIISLYNPSLIVILAYGHHPSASTQTMVYVRPIINDIKHFNKDIPIALGGTHPSALPQETLEHEKTDFIIIGEGLYQIENLLNFLNGKKNLNQIRGIAYRENKEIKLTEPEEIIKNLDTELPFYPWELLKPLNNYRAHNMHCFQYFEESKQDDFLDIRTPYATIYSSLGCPFNCDFCCINAIYQKPGIRYFSVEKVLEFIDVLYTKYGVKNIRFDDELFILDKNRVKKICNGLIERGYDLNIMAYARIDTIDETLVKVLKKSGFTWICIGYESASENVLFNINKKFKKQIYENTKTIHNSGLYILGNFIFGLPDDDFHTMELTLKTALDLECEFVNFYTLMPYPGSELYRKNKEKINGNWLSFSQHSYETIPLPTKYLSAKDVLKFRDNAFYKYFSNPNYQNLIERKFGTKVKNHINKMLQIKLKRKLLEDD